MTIAADGVLDYRCQLAELANKLGLRTAVEIGTHQGVFADEFMNLYKGTLTCVDPYLGSPAPNRTFLPCFVEHDLSRNFDEGLAHYILSNKYGNRVNFLYESSVVAAQTFERESLGLVYIDGLHDYKNVKTDLHTWWGKVYAGGILSGHDYFPGHPEARDVVKAVNEFVEAHGLVLHLTHKDAMPSWYVFKP